MSMITASLWVARGAAAAYPTKYDIDEDEMARISKLAKLQLDTAREDLDAAEQYSNIPEPDTSNIENRKTQLPQLQEDDDDDLKEYNLESYDSDPNLGDGHTMTMLGNARALAYYESNADDPYITMQGRDDEEDEEREDLRILATDNMIVAAKVEDEVAHLEVYVYEDEADNLYVHHDIMLPAIPLCVEWLDLPVGKDVNTINPDSRGNYVAVGTFDPDIEIWDLDTIDNLYPNAILGQGGADDRTDSNQDSNKRVKRRKSKKANDDYHVDAILSLAANRQHRNLLASSSADKTVKLWDLSIQKCAKSYSHHTDKVCSIAWHPRESSLLLSGSYDRTIVAADMRAPNATVPRWGVESDVETVTWDHHNSNNFYVTTENGIIHAYDIRDAPASPDLSKAIWILQAHDESVSAFDVNPIIPGFLVTGSTDKTVKLWNVQSSGPSMVVSRNVDVGKVFSARFGPDPEVAFRLVVAGSKGTMQVWDTSTNAAVRRAFASRIAPGNSEVNEERVVRIEEDSSDSEEEGGVQSRAADPAVEHGREALDDDSP